MAVYTVKDNRIKRILKIIAVFILLYAFLVSISLMSHAFKGFGEGFAGHLIKTTSNPFIGLFVGFLATSILQSSSVTTSMVVAFVASGTLSVHNAIPVVVGANIGTTVTCTLVAIGHITRREEFKRAISYSAVHSFFNILTILVLLPIEIFTGYLEKTAGFLAERFCNVTGLYLQSPLKVIINPAVKYIDIFFTSVIGLQTKTANICMLIVALVILFMSLIYLVKTMTSLVIRRTESVLDRVFGRNPVLVLIMSMLFTGVIQSSSVTTSMLVPIVASGILSMEAAFPVILGANIGTTITAILASLTGNIEGIAIAFVHLMFNITGVLLFYAIPTMRKIPLTLARKLGELSFKKRRYAIIFVVTLFYLVPGIFIFISRILK